MVAMVLLMIALPSALSCTFDDGGRRVAMTLRLDEPRGAVRYAMPATAAAVSARALFTPERVMFDGFTLDRASLAIVRDGDAITAGLGAQPRAARGWCRVPGTGSRSVTPAKAGIAPGKRER